MRPLTSLVSLPPPVEARLGELGTVDVLVGIPSFNNAHTIGHVVRAAAAGLAKHFPGARSAIVNSEGGSKDGTAEAVALAEFLAPATIVVSHPLSTVHKIVTPCGGIPGKGSAFRTIFAIAARLDAKACAVVDADLRSITPGWIELLVGPVLKEGFDFVAPILNRGDPKDAGRLWRADGRLRPQRRSDARDPGWRCLDRRPLDLFRTPVHRPTFPVSFTCA